jgi:hypothetical protein
MAIPHLVCVLPGSDEIIFLASNLDYRFAEGDFFNHTTEGVTTKYKVENTTLHVESMVGDPGTTTAWTQFVLRVTASVVP